MGLIIQVKVKNFKSFRSQAKFDFADSTYLIGVNNAGKTNIFHAIRAFFDESYFADGSFILVLSSATRYVLSVLNFCQPSSFIKDFTLS